MPRPAIARPKAVPRADCDAEGGIGYSGERKGAALPQAGLRGFQDASKIIKGAFHGC